MTSATVGALLLLYAAATVSSVQVGSPFQRKVLTNRPILALEYSDVTNEIFAYTEQEKLLVTDDGQTVVLGLLNPNELVTDVKNDPAYGKVTANYFDQCITLTRPNGVVKTLGACSRDSTGSTDITPYGVTFTHDGKVAFSDEFSNAITLWDADSDTLTKITNPKMTRPRGIVYVESTEKYYVTISNGVYSIDKHGVSEVVGTYDENVFGLKDGNFNDSVRFSFPTSIIMLSPHLFAVVDYSNNRVRMLDMAKQEVSSICFNSNCEIVAPTSIATNKQRSKLFVGTATGLLQYDLSTPSNLCYGRDSSGEDVVAVKGKIIKVWCDLDTPGGPWITVLNRYDGSEDFNRTYKEYSAGFGQLTGEHWIGLENLHLLTGSKRATLRIDVSRFQAAAGRPLSAHAVYRNFWIGDDNSQYTLQELSGYSGNAGDMETADPTLNTGGPHRGQKFSTFDRDSDKNSDNCAAAYNGGWWFRECYTACLTCGPYSNPPKYGYGSAMIYFPFTQAKVGLKSASMKIKLPQELAWGQ